MKIYRIDAVSSANTRSLLACYVWASVHFLLMVRQTLIVGQLLIAYSTDTQWRLHISSLLISEGPLANRAPIKPLPPQGWGSFTGT